MNADEKQFQVPLESNDEYSMDDQSEAEYNAWQCSRNLVLASVGMQIGDRLAAKKHLHNAGLAFAKFCSLVDARFTPAYEKMLENFTNAEDTTTTAE